MTDRSCRRALQTAQRAAKWRSRMSANATEICLVRHGETSWNLEGRMQGQLQPGPGLTPDGMRQAEAVARHLAGSSYSAIYCSDLLRAVQTAACIAAATGLPVFQEAQLRERHLGCCQGLTLEEIARTAPASMDQLRSPSPDVQIDGGGESRAELQARAKRVLVQLAACHRGERVLCITHGGFLHCCYSVATGTTYSGKNLNGALNTVLVEGRSCALVEWGQVGHLQDVHLDARGFGGGASDG